MRQRRLRRRPAAPVLPDEPAGHQNMNKLWVWTADTAGDSNGAPPSDTRPGCRLDGLLQRPAGRRPGARRPGPRLLHVRQLPPGGDGRHGRQPRRAGHRHGSVVPGRVGQPAGATGNQIEDPTAQPGSNNFYTQDGYSGGTYSELLRPLRSRESAPILDYLNADLARRLVRLRTEHLLPAEQLQPRLPGQRHAGSRPVRGPAAEREDVPDHRRRAERPQHQLGLLRPGLERRQPEPGSVLQHLQPVPVRDVDHDQPDAAQGAPARPRAVPEGGGRRARCRPSRS